MSKQGQRVLSRLRQMILSGELTGGERIAEIPTAEMLGVSRMPIRIAFRTLEQEGLLEKLPRRGYQVRELSPADIEGAVAVRGVLEGLAALHAAERGLSDSELKALTACLQEGDEIFAKGFVTEAELGIYHDMNLRFHSIIVKAANNRAINTALAKDEHLPFASVSALAVNPAQLDREYRRFNFAHLQHHAIVDALRNRQGGRAEALMREHANATLRYTDYFHDDKAQQNDHIKVLTAGGTTSLNHDSAN